MAGDSTALIKDALDDVELKSICKAVFDIRTAGPGQLVACCNRLRAARNITGGHCARQHQQ